MWWRFLTFCVLVCIVLFVVLSCIHGQPVLHLFFHRCCEDNIENDQVIFENFANNFLRERLIGDDNLIMNDNDSFVSSEEVEELLALMKNKFNVHDPKSRVNLTELEISTKNLDDNNFEQTESKKNEVTDTNINSEDSNEIDLNGNEETNNFENRQHFKDIVNDSQKDKDVTDLLTKVISSTTVTSCKDLTKSSEEVEATTENEWDSLRNVVLSELDSDESGEVTTKRADSATERKIKDLGIIK